MHSIRLVAALCLVIGSTAVVDAGTLQDTFSTNPFSGTARWCERFHHNHWDSVNLRMLAQGATLCTSPGPGGIAFSCCTQACQTNPTFHCSSAPGAPAGFPTFLITTAAQEPTTTGLNRRTSEIFALPSALDAGQSEHIALFSVTHPNCHDGFQATIFRRPQGDYLLRILKTEDPDPSGNGSFPECGSTPSSMSTDVTGIALVLGSTPRYKLSLTTNRDHDLSFIIIADASLIDTQTGATLATKHWSTSKPTWYNVQAKRYGIGGARLSPQLIIQDSFVGTAQ